MNNSYGWAVFVAVVIILVGGLYWYSTISGVAVFVK